jgi:hypothetical protein
LIRGHANGRLDGTLDIAFIGVHLHKFHPWLVRVARGIKAPLVSLLCLFSVVQPQTKISKDLPLQSSLTVGNMLCFEVSDFCSKYCPYSEILATSQGR